MIRLFDVFRLQNDDIRPGSSPQDLSVAVRDSAIVSVPFKVGSTVYYIEMTKATVTADVDGNPVVNASAATGEKVMICAPAVHMQL